MILSIYGAGSVHPKLGIIFAPPFLPRALSLNQFWNCIGFYYGTFIFCDLQPCRNEVWHRFTFSCSILNPLRWYRIAFALAPKWTFICHQWLRHNKRLTTPWSILLAPPWPSWTFWSPYNTPWLSPWYAGLRYYASTRSSLVFAYTFLELPFVWNSWSFTHLIPFFGVAESFSLKLSLSISVLPRV